MAKMKSHKGLRKRVRVSARGKVKYKQPNSGHLMSGKSGNRRRRLRKTRILLGEVRRRIVRAVAGDA